jgi:hypothetical protein
VRLLRRPFTFPYVQLELPWLDGEQMLKLLQKYMKKPIMVMPLQELASELYYVPLESRYTTI